MKIDVSREELNLILHALGWMQDYLGDDEEDKSMLDSLIEHLETISLGA